MYNKTVWTAEEGTLLNRFQKTSETTQFVELTRSPGSVTVPGTVFSVANMNNIEDEVKSIADLTYTFAGDKTFSGKVTIENTFHVKAEKSRIFVNASQNLVFGNDAFTNANDRYRVYYDGGNTNFRFDTASSGIAHVFGSFNEGGTLLDYMFITDNSIIMYKPLSVMVDIDSVQTLGKGKFGLATDGVAGSFYIGHRDQFNSTNFSMRISNSGYLMLNAPSTQKVDIRSSNVSVATFDSTKASIKKPLEVTLGGIKTNNVYTLEKEVTTTADGNGAFSVAHGLDVNKIVSWSAQSRIGTSLYNYSAIVSTANPLSLVLGSTNVSCGSVFPLIPNGEVTIFIKYKP
jgi:hypothetical protein